MMHPLVLVGVGGATGSILRYLIQQHVNTSSFPWGTFAVNVSGSLLLGILAGLLSKNLLTTQNSLLLMTGLCGGFTTFSSFSLENLHLLQQQRWDIAAGYIILSVGVGLLATFAGYKLSS
ncbi:MAG TPA: fluoride efflux transporter CrcB [Chitinophagaceae bacterium]|nr:fluoride efflux transporter CrcB [Chitinophagaceae bacterium]